MNLRAIRTRAGSLAAALLLSLAVTLVPAQSAPATGSHNLHLFGKDVRTDAAVDGDYMAFGGHVAVEHPVGIDATLAGGTVEVNAAIGDDLRVAGGTVVVKAQVGGELYGAAGDLRLAPEGRIAGDAAVAGGNIAIDGRIGGSLRAAARTIVINGEVAGDVRLNAQQIALGPKAKIGGTLSYSSKEAISRAEGSVIGGAVTDSNGERKARRAERDADAGTDDGDAMSRGWLPMGIGSVFGYLMLLALAALMLWLAPRFAARAVAGVFGSPWRSIGLGLLLVLVVPLVAVLLVLTLLGIPFALALLALYPLLTMLGFVIAAVALGQRLGWAFRSTPAAASPAAVPAPAPSASPAPTFGLAALGLLVLMLVGWLPFIGWLLLSLATLAGLGAIVLAVTRGRREPST
ncbi:MAG: hypothetical protein ABIO45_16090 [Burkholderiaceae bacterium]